MVCQKLQLTHRTDGVAPFELRINIVVADLPADGGEEVPTRGIAACRRLRVEIEARKIISSDVKQLLNT